MGPERNRLEPIQVFTRDLPGTGPERIQNWTDVRTGSIWIGWNWSRVNIAYYAVKFGENYPL